MMDESSPQIGVDPAEKSEARGLLFLAVAAGLAVGAVVATVMLTAGPHPDAILHPTGAEPDAQLIALLESEGSGLDPAAHRGFGSEMLIDLSSLRAFGEFHDFEVWSAVNAFESPCLIAIQRETSNVVARECVPAGAELFIDPDGYLMPRGERMRFLLRGETVAAYHLFPEAVD
jgi:hypothetical protein